MRQWLQIVIPLLALVGAVGLRAWDPPAIEEIRFKVFDNFQRLKPRPYEPVPVTVVDIDDDTLELVGQWPWPRTELGQLIEVLQRQGAAAIALDLVLPEPDRTSPRRVLAAIVETWPDLPETEALRALAESERLPDNDRALAGIVGRGAVVAGFAQTAGRSGTMPPRKAGFAVAGLDPKRFLADYNGAVTTLPEIAEAAAGSGAIDVQPEADGVIRRPSLLIAYGGEIYPSLAIETLRVAQGASTILIKAAGASGVEAFGANTGISEVKVGDFIVETDPRGRIWLYDTGPVPARSVPAWQIMTGTAAADRITGHIVLIGTSAAGLKDVRASPLDPVAAGVTLQAQVIEQILLGSFLKRPDWATGLELLVMVALGLLILAAYTWRRMSAAWLAALTLLVLGGAIGASWQAFARYGLMFDPVYPAMVVAVVYTASSLLRYVRTESERRQIRSAFAQYMAPALVEKLAERPELLKLGGEMREMTVLFCDIRGFTTISERYDAEALTSLINRFLTPMTDVIMANEGTIDKYMGDCIMAMWNAPLDDPDHARHACTAALSMRQGVVRLNETLKREAEAEGRPHVPLAVGIGINTGVCCVGNMGSEQRFDYSVLGDEVNLASRLEGQCKTYGVDIIIGEKTRAAAPEMAAMEIDLIRVKGKSQPARIFALVGGPEVAATEDFVELERLNACMLAAYRERRWEEVRRAAEEGRELGAPFGLYPFYDMFFARVAHLETHPPEEEWDGVYDSETK